MALEALWSFSASQECGFNNAAQQGCTGTLSFLLPPRALSLRSWQPDRCTRNCGSSPARVAWLQVFKERLPPFPRSLDTPGVHLRLLDLTGCGITTGPLLDGKLKPLAC